MERTYQVVSIGVNEHGASVVRIMVLPNRYIIEVATNIIGFAKLAAAGCTVDNARGAHTGKVS